MIQQQAAQICCLDVIHLEAERLAALADVDDYVVRELARSDEGPPMHREAAVVSQEGSLFQVAVRLVPVVAILPALWLQRAVDREDSTLGLEPAIVPLVAPRSVDHLEGVTVLRGEDAVAEAREKYRVNGLGDLFFERHGGSGIVLLLRSLRGLRTSYWPSMYFLLPLLQQNSVASLYFLLRP